MKKLLCIAVLLLSGMLIVPVDGGAAAPSAAPAQAPVWTNTNKLKNVKPTVTKPTQRTKTAGAEIEKQRPSIEFKNVTIMRRSKGEWYWDVKIKATQNRQVAPNTAKIMVWQNAGGKKTLLESRTYDRPINPGYGYMVNRFFPSAESDTLDFELIELKQPSGKLQSHQSANNVVDRATVAVPPFGIEMTCSYSFAQEPAHFSANLKNSSPWPMRVRWVIQAGGVSHWTDEINNEVVLLQKNSDIQVKENWPYTEKGAGYYKMIVKLQLLDPATGKVNWTEISSKKGNLPTNR